MSVIEVRDPDDIWFQQDGATWHTAHASGRWIGNPRSCDITPLDFLLWGYVMSKFHRDKLAPIDELKAKIVRVFRQNENWNFSMGQEIIF